MDTFSSPASTGACPTCGRSSRTLDGSFLYPPVFSSASEVIDFWSRVEIPDEVLARAERVYRETYEPLCTSWPASSWGSYVSLDWDEANPAPDSSDTGATADWEGRKRAAQVDWEQQMAEYLPQRPESLERRDVRPLVRATAMFRSAAGDLDWDGYKEVSRHEVNLTTGPKSVQDAAVHSALAAVASRFLDADKYHLDGVSKDDIRQIVQQTVTQALGEQNVALDKALDELNDNLGIVGGAVIDANDTRRRRR